MNLKSHLKVIALTVIITACASFPWGRAHAQSTRDDVETMALEGLKQILQAMELFVDSIPLYEAPEVLPNGDIIIRRIPGQDAPRETQKEGEDISDT